MHTFYFIWEGNNALLRKSESGVEKIEAPNFEAALVAAEKINKRLNDTTLRMHKAFLAVPIDEPNWLAPKWSYKQ